MASPTSPKTLDEFGGHGIAEAQHVLPDQHLAVALGPRADADDRYFQLLADAGGQGGGHAFQHQGKGPGLLQSAGVVQQLLGGGQAFAPVPCNRRKH